MLAHDRVAPATLFKIGPHGSRTSMAQEFLRVAAPEDTVVSVGGIHSNTPGMK
jgi:beta-lactamase superfamily II metal-dependent hydrolase